MASASPMRDRARDVMMRFVDTFVGVLIRVAADCDDPLNAVGRMLTGDEALVVPHVSTNEVRALLFAAFNMYDVHNARLLRDDALFAFLSDFMLCFSSSMAELGPDLATTPDESWEDRARWDSMGSELSARAARMRAGFNRDPDMWVGRWSSMLDTLHDGKGLRYAEVQFAFAGTGTPEWLREIHNCSSIAEAPGSPHRHPLLLQDVSDREASVQRSMSRASARRTTRNASASPTAPPEMTLDIADAACAMREDIRHRHGIFRFVYYSLYFALLAAVLSLHMGNNAYPMQRFLVGNLVHQEFSDRKELHDVRTISDVWLWLDRVWAPFVFQDYSLRRVAQSNVVAATPFLRQRRRRVKTLCEEPVNIVVYDRASERPCYTSGYADTPIVGAHTGFAYNPVDYTDPYHAPREEVSGSSDFLISFPQHNSSDVAALPGYMRNVSTEAEAVAALHDLRQDAWLSSQTAFLEVHTLLYNADTDVLGVSKVVFVQTSAGNVLPLADTTSPFARQHGGSVLLARPAVRFRSDTASSVQIALEVFILFATVAEFAVFEVFAFIDAYRQTQAFFGYFRQTLWNYVQLLYFCVFAVYVVLYITYALLPEPSNTVNTLDNFSNNGLGPIYPVMLVFGGILIVVALLRLLRNVGTLTPSISVISGVLGACAGPLIALLVLFMLAVVVFAVIGYYFFGHGFESFATMGNAVQMVIDFIIRGIDYSDLNSPLADPSYGVFPPIYYWALVIVLLLLFMSLLIAVFVTAYDTVLDKAAQQRRESLDIPSTGRIWSRRSVLNNAMNYSGTLLNTWRINGWVVPVATGWRFNAVASAEIVSGSNVRVIISTPDKESISSCTGILFLTPREMLKSDLGQKRGSFVSNYALFTRCSAGREPHLYGKRDWCRYTEEWWMKERHVQEFANGGQSWMSVEEGVNIISDPTELHRRTLFLAEFVKGQSPAVVDSRHYTNTQLVPFEMGSYRTRVLRITRSCSELFQGPEWEHESLVFEFRDVISSKWHASLGRPGVRQLPVKGIYRTYRPLQVPGDEFAGSKLVVVLGEQPVPDYVCEKRERQTATAIKTTCTSGTLPYAEDMIIARFGVSNERFPHIDG